MSGPVDDYDELADAIIEDTVRPEGSAHIICPRCRAVTSALAGDDTVVCWRCDAVYDPDQVDWTEQDRLWLELIEELRHDVP
jgi:hypothetical protein